MPSPYVCQTCRQRLRQLLTTIHRRRTPSTFPQQQRYISLGDIVPPLRDPAEQQSARENASQQERTSSSGIQYDVDPADGTVLRTATPVGRYSRYKGITANLEIINLREQGTDVYQAKPAYSKIVEDKRSYGRLEEGSYRRSRPQKDHRPSAPDVLAQDHDRPVSQPDNDFSSRGSRKASLQPKERKRTSATKDKAAAENEPRVKCLTDLVLNPQADGKAAWAYFKEHFVDQNPTQRALRMSAQDRALVRSKHTFSELLRLVASQWQPGAEASITPAEVVKTLHDYRIIAPAWYVEEILDLLYRAIKIKGEKAAKQSLEKRILVEEQLLSLWSQFLRNAANPSKKEAILESGTLDDWPISWHGTPDPEKMHLSKRSGRSVHNFPTRLHELFEGVAAESKAHLAAAALLTFDYFTYQYYTLQVTADRRVKHLEFLKLVRTLLHGCKDVEIESVGLCLGLLEDNSIPKAKIDATAARLKKLQQKSEMAEALDDMQVFGANSINLTEEQEGRLTGYLMTRIKRQVERKNVNVLDQLWTMTQLIFQSDDVGPEGPSKIILPKIYSAFLFGYRELQEPEKQAVVWNHMRKAGLAPTIEQWGLLISARKRHLNSMEQIWDAMIASGARADRQIWCSRLSAHILYGQPEHGIQLLYQWSKAWFEEVSNIFKSQKVEVPAVAQLTRDGPTIARPDSDVLTTVVTAVIKRQTRKDGRYVRARRLDLVPDAFAWAQSYGIKPNLWVYNLLFRECLLDGNLEEAMQILAKMEEDKLSPDQYTFYTFAEFVFRQSDKTSMSLEEQYKLLDSILGMLEQRGFEPNATFFGIVIDGLVKRGRVTESANEPNIGAAMLLLRVMLKKEMIVTPQIWTSLMTHYFRAAERRPDASPDWAAINALWETMTNTSPLVLDNFFYDRVIEGFAYHGDSARAELFLTRMVKEGKRPSWHALKALLISWIKTVRMDKAQLLVTDACHRSGVFAVGAREGTGEKSVAWERVKFFEVADNAGLKTGGGAKQNARQDEDKVQETETSEKGNTTPLNIEQEFDKDHVSYRRGWDEFVEMPGKKHNPVL